MYYKHLISMLNHPLRNPSPITVSGVGNKFTVHDMDTSRETIGHLCIYIAFPYPTTLWHHP